MANLVIFFFCFFVFSKILFNVLILNNLLLAGEGGKVEGRGGNGLLNFILI